MAAYRRNYTATNGDVWVADPPYATGGQHYSPEPKPDINGTVEDGLYQRERYGEFNYTIPVPCNGKYKVVLHFAEILYVITVCSVCLLIS
jgi:Malectin domain